MASVTVYNQSTGDQYNIDLNVSSYVLAGSASGAPSWYVSVSTTKKTAANESIRAIVVEDITMGTLTDEIEAAIATIMLAVEGHYAFSSSSSSSSESPWSHSTSSSLNSSSSSNSSSSKSSNSSNSSSTVASLSTANSSSSSSSPGFGYQM